MLKDSGILEPSRVFLILSSCPKARSLYRSAVRAPVEMKNPGVDGLGEVGFEAVEVGVEDLGLGGVVDELAVFF